MSAKTYEELIAIERVVINKETCIACGACISSCPNSAIEVDEEGKATLIFELCDAGKPDHEPECIKACPIQADCLWIVSEAPEEVKKKADWFIVKDKRPEVLKALNEWKRRYKIG